MDAARATKIKRLWEIEEVTQQSSNRAIIVLGMHRSGTSALARGLEAIGVNLGGSFIPSVSTDNATGYFEDAEINALNIEVLRVLGHDWHHVRSVTLADVAFLQEKGYVDKAADLLRRKCAESVNFAFKDPRTCKLMPFWRSVITRSQVQDSYVVALRNPLSVAQSLKRRDGLPLEKGCAMWLDHVITSLWWVQGSSFVVVDYDFLMENPLRELGRVAQYLELPFDEVKGERYRCEFLTESMRHTVYGLNDLDGVMECSPLAREIYAAMRDAATDGSGQISPTHLAGLIKVWAAEYERTAAYRSLIDETATRIADLNVAVSDRENQIAILNARLSERDPALRHRDEEMEGSGPITVYPNRLRSTCMARATGGVRKTHAALKNATLRRLQRLSRWGGARGAASALTRVWRAEGFPGVVARLRAVWRTYGTGTVTYALRKTAAPETLEAYAGWLEQNRLTEEAADEWRMLLGTDSQKAPLISVLMPVYNTPGELLAKALRSLVIQVYTNWEVCIANDASTNAETLQVLADWVAQDPRVRVKHLNSNQNISVATNEAASIARGDYFVFLDHDDELEPDALAEIALAIRQDPGVDYIYSDDDKVGQDGRRYAPQFKPEFSPVLLLSYMYMSHLKCVRGSLFRDLGGFRVGFEGAQDYDFALRLAECTRSILHIPKVLYHWRATCGSTALSADEKPKSIDVGLRALADALWRRGIAAEPFQPDWAIKARVGIYDLRFPDEGPHVTLIIPTKNQARSLARCLGSLTKTTYRNYSVVIVDNESNQDDALAYLESLRHAVLKIGNPDGGRFNYAYLNNEAVKNVQAEYVLFLNDDTEVISPNWLSQMVGYAQMEGVGAVGAKLLFPGKTIQHAGIVHGLYGGMAGPAFRGAPEWNKGYLSYTAVTREYGAVTAACLLMRRDLFLEVGGFDQEAFAVAYNDVDLCYRIVDAGLSCVYCHSAQLYHYEGTSRGRQDNVEEIARFRLRYHSRRDAWYNPNLSLDDEQFNIRPYHHPIAGRRGLRIAMVTHNLNNEGAPNSQLELAVGLARRGFDPVVFSPLDGPLRHVYENNGIVVKVMNSPLAEVRRTADLEEKLRLFVDSLRSTEIAVVHCNTLQTFWGVHAAKMAQLPAIWNPRESAPWQTYFDFLSPELRSVAYNCFGYPYRVIFVAHATRAIWEPLNTHRNFATIHNGLDASRFLERTGHITRASARAMLGVGEGEVVVVLVGTVCERKGQIDIVHAMRCLGRSSTGRVRIFIVGDRPSVYSELLHREADALPLSLRGRLGIVAETGDIAPFYQAGDIAVCASRNESFPRVVLEAMACGLPLITTPVFGIVEQVQENVNALFYEPGDIAMLTRHLERLIQDQKMRHTFGENSKAVLAAVTSYDEMLARYAEAFREARFTKGTIYYLSEDSNLGEASCAG